MTGEGKWQEVPVCHELVQQAPQSPEVASEGVLLVLPQLWRHVVRRANLCIGHSFPDHLGNTQITDLHLHFVPGGCQQEMQGDQRRGSEALI